MNIRQMEGRDFEAYRRLLEEAYIEYLEFLSRESPQLYLKEQQERREVTRARFDFYLKTGSSFIAEENGNVIGYVTSQKASFIRGCDAQLWVEYIVVQSESRKRGIGLALLHKLVDYAKRHGIDQIYTTMNPDNEASIKLHQKAGFNVKNWKTASCKVG